MNHHLYLLKQAFLGIGIRPESLQPGISDKRLGLSVGFPYLVGLDYDLREDPNRPGWRVAPGFGLTGPFISFSHQKQRLPKVSKMKKEQPEGKESKKKEPEKKEPGEKEE